MAQSRMVTNHCSSQPTALNSLTHKRLFSTMPSKINIAASAVAAALAMAPAISAVPVARSSSSCTSLGKGALGFNSSHVGIYSKNPPAAYLSVHDSILWDFGRPTWQEQTQFEFFSCLHTPPPEYEEGSVDTYQGYIVDPWGQCVTIEEKSSGRVPVKVSDCKYTGDNSRGGVHSTQHFQFQLDSFYDFYSAVFLGDTAGPVNASDFGAGGNTHFSLDGNFYAIEGAPQNGDLSQMLIGQLGDQYKPTTRMMSPCTLVKNGTVELVNTQTGETQSVTAASTKAFPYGVSPLVNGTGDAQFSFYKCYSAYEGYLSDDTNIYGQFTSNEYGGGGAFHYQTPTNTTGTFPINNFLIQSGGSNESENDDTSAQDGLFFRMTKTSDGDEITFLGGPKDSNPQEYGYSLDNSPQQTDGYSVILVEPSSSTNYKLRFTN